MSDENSDFVPELRRGILAARNNYRIAMVALQRYSASDKRDLESLTLYGGAFFVFARASLDALRFSDARDDPSLSAIQSEYFENRIKSTDVFRVIKMERDLIAHGNDSWAIHAFKPLGLVDRAIQENDGQWMGVVFDDSWPFSPFKGEPVLDVMEKCLREIGTWLDEIDTLHANEWMPTIAPDQFDI